jgi:hypothetical protein
MEYLISRVRIGTKGTIAHSEIFGNAQCAVVTLRPA